MVSQLDPTPFSYQSVTALPSDGVTQQKGVILHVVESPPKSVWYAFLKRTIDVLGAAIGLVLLSPLLLVIALAVAVTSPGGVLFSQKRYGRGQVLFRIYKFRTLWTHLSDNSGVSQVIAGDQRVAPIGKFLRHTSLDELPQLWNVLKGDMSLVGPRPHVPRMKACGVLYENLFPNYSVRHEVKPGLTGLAQVEGFRGPTECYEDAFGRIEMDLQYVQHWTPLLDIIIILRTMLGGFLASRRQFPRLPSDAYRAWCAATARFHRMHCNSAKLTRRP